VRQTSAFGAICWLRRVKLASIFLQTLERALLQELADVKRKQWQEENRGAIAAYNEYIEERQTILAAIDFLVAGI
jgi:post-segregation antitoxin (ccd killing protein)